MARGAGDTIVSTAVASGPSFPAGVHTVPFAEPLYDTIALVQRAGAPLAPATRELARLARRMLLERGDAVQRDGPSGGGRVDDATGF